MIKRMILIVLAMVLPACAVRGERIKDIVSIKGARGNPLFGYGLVIGLNGTGDDSPASQRALANLLRTQKITLTPNDLSSKNIASVIVTAELGPFAGRDSRIDVTVSAIGNAKSLQGGTLLMTPLMGADREVYAVAQGNIILGGFAASGKASTVSKNHVTVGTIPDGAHVERDEPVECVQNGEITLMLSNPDFATASRIAKAINEAYPDSSHAVLAGAVRVRLPQTVTKTRVTEFIQRIGALEVEVDAPAMVVINERTGTIIVGENVGISTVAISHGSLSIVTREKQRVSQPNPLNESGQTVKSPETELRTVEEQGTLHIVPRQTSVADLARALNAMGLTPRDLISIFQALKAKGALQAKLKII